MKMREGSQIKVVKIDVDKIRVGNNHRPLKQKRVRTIADSMKLIGLKTPISVRFRDNEEVRLVAGHYRLEAAKSLSWRQIDCIVVAEDQIGRQLWLNAENLHRVALTKLERSEAIMEWDRLAKKRRKGAQDAHPVGGRQPNDKGISKTAKELGVSRKTVQLANKIAKEMSPEAKAAAEAVGLDQNQSALLEITKEPTSKAQVAKVHKLAKRERKDTKSVAAVDEKAALLADVDRLKAKLAAATECCHKLEALVEKERTRASDDIPPALDRQPLSPNDQRAFEAIKDGLANSPQFLASWVTASMLVRHRIFREVLLSEAAS
jgi:ParB-like chromosome segregation protein Spo0J